ncbi:hypothetical protein PpBr36_00303 [Pyricularia pennisetigena]|uniref:hypothetical protein n=1 Tax=Pyricularia pennisetigena TaxID=1578925 RepID=UPI00114ECE17|nr:hypothetical protein PpBr36_00303 [Pyricularia pennisetigena]TLS28841.1 hypothetical protein PpBr36_00303 [Pyricularia pennisetigena]
MPVPFETLIPYAIITAMFGVSGAGISAFRRYTNGGKRPRRSIDQWDRMITQQQSYSFSTWGRVSLIRCATVMDRDRRLTGFLRGQSDNPIAPPGFELNNPWRTEERMS